MVRKLTLVLIFLISISMMCLPAYAQRRGRGVRGGGGTSFGSFIVSIIPSGSSDYIPVVKSHGVLRIKVTPEDAEIFINGRFVGLARDFKGPAVISAPSGNHLVELKHNDASRSTNVNIVKGSDTSVFYSFNTD